MCSDKVIEFGARVLRPDEVAGKRVIELGARVVQDPSMTLRHHIESLHPDVYVGVDIEPGLGVDVVCPAEHVVEHFGSEGDFDVVVSTELLEHVLDWRPVVSNLKRICKPGGVLLVTTRSLGFPYHAWPHDHWRYEISDVREIFADMEILALEPDPKEPGVFLKARKPSAFDEQIPDVALYSMIASRRVRRVGAARRHAFSAVMGGRRAYQRSVPESFRAKVNTLLRR